MSTINSSITSLSQNISISPLIRGLLICLRPVQFKCEAHTCKDCSMKILSRHIPPAQVSMVIALKSNHAMPFRRHCFLGDMLKLIRATPVKSYCKENTNLNKQIRGLKFQIKHSGSTMHYYQCYSIINHSCQARNFYCKNVNSQGTTHAKV